MKGGGAKFFSKSAKKVLPSPEKYFRERSLFTTGRGAEILEGALREGSEFMNRGPRAEVGGEKIFDAF